VTSLQAWNGSMQTTAWDRQPGRSSLLNVGPRSMRDRLRRCGQFLTEFVEERVQVVVVSYSPVVEIGTRSRAPSTLRES
jgi:hypothetical protein